MRLRWPWSRKHHPEGNGHVAREAKQRAEEKLQAQRERWPEVTQARDALAEMVERAMRGHA